MVEISTDKKRIDSNKVIQFLTEESYWGKSRSQKQILISIENSMCFGMYQNNEMIGFARVVTDFGVFAYLADVFIDKEYREMGYAKKLIKEILNHADLKMISRWMLGTMDAHELYRPFEFKEVEHPKRWMEYMPKGS